VRILHAIHDFLPRHRAGSEIYAFELARESSRHFDVCVLAAEYDVSTPHGTIRWRTHEGLPVVEIVNNWRFRSFDETYTSERINAQLSHVLDATRPDVLHIHNLLNLSLDLPRLAKERGIATVATLHDYTLVCPSGGQRVHVPESHVCESIDPDRCARCFNASHFSLQMRAAQATSGPAGRLGARAARMAHQLLPTLTTSALRSMTHSDVTAGDIRRRLAYARQVFEAIDVWVAPSQSIADEFCRMGMSPDRVHVSDYGFEHIGGASGRRPHDGPLTIGFVGTLVWHKGVHVLVEAARGLRGSFQVEVHGDTAVFPEYVATLRRSAAGVPITFAGGFDRDRMQQVYGNLDVLVVPSLWPENSPLVIHEAFMHHLPVVAARTGGIPQLVVDGITGLLYEPFSVDALRQCLQRVIDDRLLLHALSEQSPPVKSIAEDAREWQDRYRAVCARPSAGVRAWA
jgi:glycosyltransferase involved in cell wall biosynthesis